ncbi:MAG: NAD(P)H-hydrate dehydratase [Bacteroidales bacterium]|nr:NAD(P)H-hydrate dehydratase [Bacteroidales bacterium]
MKIYDAVRVREIDNYTIMKEPVESIDLMERAATRLAGWYVRHFNTSRRVVIFAGPGNNGGDALAMARLLAESQFRVDCYLLGFGRISEDCAINRDRLLSQGRAGLEEIGEGDILPEIDSQDVVVDGIFGSGLSRKVTGFPGNVIRYINEKAGMVIAIDIPSGLFGEDNNGNDYASVIRADYTLTFQFPFLSFFFDSNEPYVGRWRVHDIKLHPRIIQETDTPYRTIEKDEVLAMLPGRKRFSHKGTFGHALIISGCYGMMGAALLAGESCLRGGAGLVTLHVPRFGYNIIQTGFPEALVSMDQSDILFSAPPELSPYSAVGIGPGIGCKQNTGKGLKQLLETVKIPMVIDADGLNILSEHPEWYKLLPEGTILTPHPKEFDRLAGESKNSFQRHVKQREFSRKHNVIVVLKGAYTGIATPDGNYWFNTSGNPGMATGGSGDVLTGLITGLLAQGLQPREAALAGVYLHGLAGDLAVHESSEEAVIASDLMRQLGSAFREVRKMK